jgi:hypothetical protein
MKAGAGWMDQLGPCIVSDRRIYECLFHNAMNWRLTNCEIQRLSIESNKEWNNN